MHVQKGRQGQLTNNLQVILILEKKNNKQKVQMFYFIDSFSLMCDVPFSGQSTKQLVGGSTILWFPKFGQSHLTPHPHG